MSELLAELHTSHLGFYHRDATQSVEPRGPQRDLLGRRHEFGKCWIFQDVRAGGAAAIAGISD